MLLKSTLKKSFGSPLQSFYSHFENQNEGKGEDFFLSILITFNAYRFFKSFSILILNIIQKQNSVNS
jgi:hypothetical protein